jgi:uncharacterized protein (TIGR04255 family)
MSQPLEPKQYARAPITEAVIEVRITAEVSAKHQETVARRLKRFYPHAAPLQAFSVKIDTTGGNVGVEQQSQGFRLTSDEQTDVVLVNPTGVATARLAPYPGWPVLTERAKFVWQTWRKSTPPRPIARVGIRTINRIDVPLNNRPVISLETYLNFHPQVPDLSPAAMAGYMMQVTLPTSVELWMATITSALVTPPLLLNHTSLLLDIDIFRTEEIPGKDSDLWAVIDQARRIKNDIFERCITDETRRLISY